MHTYDTTILDADSFSKVGRETPRAIPEVSEIVNLEIVLTSPLYIPKRKSIGKTCHFCKKNIPPDIIHYRSFHIWKRRAIYRNYCLLCGIKQLINMRTWIDTELKNYKFIPTK
jgi:hypothetical protein